MAEEKIGGGEWLDESYKKCYIRLSGYYVIDVYCTNCGQIIDHFNFDKYNLNQVHAITHIPKGVIAKDYIDSKPCPCCQCKYVLKPHIA